MSKFKVLHYADEPSDVQYVGEAKLIQWACDDIENGKHEGPKPATVEEAIEILHDVGDVEVRPMFEREQT